MEELVRRAAAGYLKQADTKAWPDATSSAVTRKGLRYIVLRHAGRVLAVYRVQEKAAATVLRRMKRPPKGLID
jgi:hypothetical protein